MKTITLSLMMSAVLLPVQAGAVTVTTVTTSTFSQGNVTSGGSVFNPFPLLGAAAPLGTSPTTFNASPIVGNAPPTPTTGTSIFNPFPLAGASAPLAVAVQPLTPLASGSAAARFPEASGGTLRPAAMSGSTLAPSLPVAGTPVTTTTITTLPGLTSSASTAIQSTVTTTIPLSLALTGTSVGLTGTAVLSTSSVLVQNPEPSTLLLLASGCAALVWWFRKQWGKTAFEKNAGGIRW